jgi:hypothetical protein
MFQVIEKGDAFHIKNAFVIIVYQGKVLTLESKIP